MALLLTEADVTALLPMSLALEAVEREAEEKELCKRCGAIIPPYSEGVCPSCLKKKKLLLRLFELARPYRWKLWLALGLTFGALAEKLLKEKKVAVAAA